MQCAFSCGQQCARVISVIFDGWSLGNVLVVGVANVIERGDSNVVTFNSDAAVRSTFPPKTPIP